MLRLGGTGSASVRERLVGPGKDLEQACPHWQSQCHPAECRSAVSSSFPLGFKTRLEAIRRRMRVSRLPFGILVHIGCGWQTRSAWPSASSDTRPLRCRAFAQHPRSGRTGGLSRPGRRPVLAARDRNSTLANSAAASSRWKSVTTMPLPARSIGGAASVAENRCTNSGPKGCNSASSSRSA